MFRILFFGFLAGLFGWPRPVYVYNETEINVDGGDGFISDGASYDHEDEADDFCSEDVDGASDSDSE